MNLRGKKVLVVGFGRSGQAAARYCAGQGACVTVTDSGPSSQFAEMMPSFAPLQLTTYFGGHPDACFQNVDVIVVSPGVPELKQLAEARAKGVPVVGELELAVQEISAKIVAITGTNGKSTTTALVGHLLAEAGLRTCVGGNIGTPLLDLLHDAKKADVVVLEVSSYQLETTPSLKPHVAVLLNITPDHLDRYGSMTRYIAAKALLFQNQSAADVCIYNIEDAEVVALADHAKARKLPFSTQKSPVPWRLSDTQLTGAHNFENMIAATLVAESLGVSHEAIARGLKGFQGLPHRLQLVREWRGVQFYDDSKGTNVGAVVKSLAGFSVPVHLIAGGQGKGGGYAELRPVVQAHVKSLILMGQAAIEMQQELGDLVPTVIVDSMALAVKAAADRAKPGEVVLLSPACASFDMFRDYADRGDQFCNCVKELAA
jgi:UDP-N-acetylmuramoylalanine--D-glutamate ligase